MNTEKTNTLGSCAKSSTRRPLEEVLDNLECIINRADYSLDDLAGRLDPLLSRGHIVEGKTVVQAPSERSVVVSHISSQIIKIEKLVARIEELHRNLDV